MSTRDARCVAFVVGAMSVDGEARTALDHRARVEASLRVEVDGVVVLAEPHFNVVDLAVQLLAWPRRGAFDYDCISSDDEGIVRFTPDGETAHRLTSSWSDQPGVVVETRALAVAVDEFIAAVEAALQARALPSLSTVK